MNLQSLLPVKVVELCIARQYSKTTNDLNKTFIDMAGRRSVVCYAFALKRGVLAFYAGDRGYAEAGYVAVL